MPLSGKGLEKGEGKGKTIMMEVVPRAGETIEEIRRDKNALYLRQEAGLIRLIPWADNMIRISYTKESSFKEEGSPDETAFRNEAPDGFPKWQDIRTEREIRLVTSLLQVIISRDTGSLRFERRDGTRLLAERERESREAEVFDAYRTVDGEAAVEEIRTADGVKRRIRDAARVFDRKLYHTTLHLDFQPDEKLYGLGQAQEGVWNLRHTTQYLHQANLKIAIPMLVSDRGYGLMLATESPAVFDDTAYGTYFHTEADAFLDYYLIAGDPEEIVKGYRLLTGKAALLPRWAFGYIQSQERYEDAAGLLDAAKRFRSTQFGLDALVLDWLSWPEGQWGQKSFDSVRFPDPAGMIRSLREQDIRFMISVWPSMAPGCPDYEEFRKEGLLFPNSNIYDAFSGEGRKLYWQQAEKGLFRHGVDAWWCDSSEPVTPEWERLCRPPAPESYRTFVEEAGKLMPADKANAYGLYHARGIYEGQRGESEEKRVVNLTRSGYPGIQKYGAILWSGDISASWDTLRRQIVAGLQFCICGLPYWTLDIGAFFVKKGPQWYWDGAYPTGLENPGYRELYVRWYQYGAFLPVFRSHGTDVRREPWNFGRPGEVFYDALLAANRLRYRLMPYLYSLAGDVWRSDSLIMRPLFYDFPKDPNVWDISGQFMFGPALMVCPVTKPILYGEDGAPLAEADRTMRVYLPAGCCWYDFHTQRRYEGGEELDVEILPDRIPVFVRAGSILPVTEPKASTAQTVGADVELLAYAGADGNFALYEDAGDGWGYEKGDFCITDLVYEDQTGSLTWKTRGNAAYRQGKLVPKIIGKK